jgi:hypothetical protein
LKRCRHRDTEYQAIADTAVADFSERPRLHHSRPSSWLIDVALYEVIE